MDIRELQYFVQVADFGNFSLAAEKLYISQPALSKVVQKIETELGYELFYADQRQQKLTIKGQELYKKALRVIQELDDINRLSTASISPSIQNGTVYFGFPPIAGNSFFAELMVGFSEKFSNIHLSIKEEGSYRIMSDIDSGILDIGCVVLPVPENKYNIIPFAQDVSRLVVSSQHPLANRTHALLQDLKDERFILLGADYVIQNKLGPTCQKLGFTPNIVQTSTQWDYIIQMVRLNLGITFLPTSLLCRYHIPDVSILDISGISSIEELALITGKGPYHSKRVDQFISYIIQQSSHPAF